jgi:hypothetical protein
MVFLTVHLSLFFFSRSYLEFENFAKKDKVPRMVPSIAQVVFVTSPKTLSEPQLPTLWLVCGALGRISMRLTCDTWCCWAKDRIQEETSHATWSRCASVWNIFICFSKHSLLWDSPLAFILEGGHVSLFLCSFIGALFYMLLEHILSLFLFFSMTPLSFCKITRREISLDFGVFIFGG